jgi:UDP-N-acetylmuramate dehydrogenase
MKDYKDYSLLNHNTFGIDAKCVRFLEYSSVEEAQQVSGIIRNDSLPFIIIGEGSNLLLKCDYEGNVVHSSIHGIEVSDRNDRYLVRCGSGEVFDDIVAYCVEHGYYGAENLSLIPGEVGASAIQNIGAYGAEAKDIIDRIEAVEIATGKIVVFDNADCDYRYRQSKFKNEWRDKFLITYVTYRLEKTFRPKLDYGNIRAKLEEKNIPEPTAKELRDIIIEIRNAKLPDPKVTGNAGSFFMNPIVDIDKFNELNEKYPGMPYYKVTESSYKIPAGWMIEQCGWKGKRLGNAGVHDKQALVLINCGGASGQDIIKLCETIRHDVFMKFGIEINPEVNIR